VHGHPNDSAFISVVMYVPLVYRHCRPAKYLRFRPIITRRQIDQFDENIIITRSLRLLRRDNKDSLLSYTTPNRGLAYT